MHVSRMSLTLLTAVVMLMPAVTGPTDGATSAAVPLQGGPIPSCDPGSDRRPTATLSPDTAAAPVQVVVQPPPAEAPPVRAWRGTWRRMPASPLTARTDASAIWTRYDGRIIIWGGRGADGSMLGDGATYDVRHHRWRMMPASPIEPRAGASAFWDKAGMLVIGGTDANGAGLTDGVAFDVDRGEWSTIDPGLPVGPISASGDWNGLTAAAPDPCGGAPSFTFAESAPYRAWTAALRLPLPAGDRIEVVAPSYDQPLILSETSTGAVGVVHQDGWPKGWGPLLRLPVVAGDGSDPVFDDERVAWFRTAVAPVPGTHETGAYGVIGDPLDPGAPWRMTPTPPAGVVDDPGLLWSPRQLVSPATMTAFDPVAWRWQTLPPLPDGSFRSGASAAWASGRLYLWGGRDAAGVTHDDGWVFTPTLPRNTYRLPETFPGDCGGVGVDGVWRLRGDPDDPMVAWFQQGSRRVPTFWPDGYVARFGPRLDIIAPDGTVYASNGDKYFEGAGKHHSRLQPCWTGTSADF
jgi:hypothetical protein